MHIKTSDLPVMNLGFGDYTCNWGTHFCGIYETEAERDTVMYNFLAMGVQDKALLVCCPCECCHDKAEEKISSLAPDFNPDDKDSFKLLRPAELYYPDGIFSPQHILKAHDDIWADNLRDFRKNVRGTADMSWAREKVPGVENLMAYESLLNTFIWEKQWISICLYDVNIFPGSMIMKVLQVHPFVITGGGVFENPYFVQPEQWLAKYAPEYLGVLKAQNEVVA
jgi:hypothetical protein